MTQSTPAPFNDAIEVLNYALTLEHLEATFYREGLAAYDAAAYVALAQEVMERSAATAA